MPASKPVTADENTLCYLAGVFDGEGCVSAAIQVKNTCLLSVSVVMTDIQAVQLFHEVFGGFFRFKNDETKKFKSKKVYTWNIYNAESLEALRVFSKYCRVKKEVCEAGFLLAKRFSPGKAGPAVPIEEKVERLILMKRIRELVGRTTLSEERIESFLKQRYNGAKKVTTDTGLIFNSQSEAARHFGVHTTAINAAVINGHKSCGLSWRFLDDN